MLMPSIYQQDSLQALLGLFLEGQGIRHGSKAGNSLRTVVGEKATTSKGDLK